MSEINQDSFPVDPKVIGIEHGALVCDEGNGRVRLIAMSDLVDVEAMEREAADEEMRNRIKLLEYEQKRMGAHTSI